MLLWDLNSILQTFPPQNKVPDVDKCKTEGKSETQIRYYFLSQHLSLSISDKDHVGTFN